MVLFEERQKFNQKWLWAVLIGCCALSIVSIYPSLATVHYWMAVLPLMLTLLLTAAMASFTMTTRLYQDRVEVGFAPWFTRTIKLHDVAEANVRTYDPIREYGGWGWRSGANGTAYNVMGKQGLQLKLHSGKRLLIGTQRPAELAETLGTFWKFGNGGPRPSSSKSNLDNLQQRKQLKEKLL